MATYVNNLRLKEIVTGAESGTWGTSTNTNLELIADALGSGTEAITTNADTHTTTIADGAADEGRALFLKYTGTLDSACTITLAPNTINKMWFIENATSGSQNIIISQGSGANITIGNGKVAVIFTDGAGAGAAVLDALADLELSTTLTVGTDASIGDDLTLASDSAVLNFGADSDVSLTHVADTALLLNSTRRIQFNDSSQYIGASSSADLDLAATTDINLDCTTVDVNAAINVSGASTLTGNVTMSADASVGDDLTLGSDAAVLNFGADSDVSLTHVADTALLLNSTRKIQFNDSSQYIGASSSADLDLAATTDINLDCTTVDVNAAINVSGVSTLSGVTTHGDDVVSDTDSTDDLGTTGVRWANLWVDDVVATTTVKPGTLVLGAGSITDTSGEITFDNENLVTTGTLGSGALTAGTIAGTTITGSRQLFINGTADEIQLLVQGHSTQTSELVVFENSSGTNKLEFTNAGNLELKAGTFQMSNNVAFKIKDSGSTARDVLLVDGSDIIQIGNDSLATNISADLVISGAVTRQLFINGTADEIQLLVQGHSTQTSELVVFENSSGTNKLEFTNAGNLELKAGTFQMSNNVAFKIKDQGGVARDVLLVDSSDIITIGNGSLATNISADLTVTGALSKGSGSFKIDHPLPAKKDTHHLVHSFIEGPQADLIYRGVVTLSDGAATVDIDVAAGMTEGTFELLCRDVQCFTANETDWTAVRGSVSGSVVTIEAEDASSTAAISWMVIGERKDAHIMEAGWTDDEGRVIVEPEKEDI
jgi:hypothetical protein